MLYHQINNLIVILFFSSLILLSFIYFTNPLRINKKGNQWLAVFLLLYASFWVEEIVDFSGFDRITPAVLTIIHASQILTPPTLYIAIIYYSHPDFSFKRRHCIHLIIPVFYMLIRFLMYSNPGLRSDLRLPAIALMLFQGLLYATLSWFKIRKHKKNILQYSSNIRGINLKWLEYIIIQVMVLCIIIILHNIFVSTTDINLFINVVQLITVFFIAHFSLKQKEIFKVKEPHLNEILLATNSAENADNPNEKKKVLPDNELHFLKNRLKKLMEDEEPYLDSELNLVRLAGALEITSHQLSYVINTGFGENFFRFVNKYRIEKSKELLLMNNATQTMIGIAFDSGFNSKTSFNTTFKKMTGVTPSEYKKQELAKSKD